MQVAEHFLVRADEEDAQLVVLTVADIVEHDGVVEVFAVVGGEACDRAVAVAGHVGEDAAAFGSPKGSFSKSLAEH